MMPDELARRLPKTWMEFWYLLLTPVLTSMTTLVVFMFISQRIDTEWFAVGGAGLASFLGQQIGGRRG